LVIGLVGAIGVDLTAVSAALGRALETVNYTTRDVRLIELVAALDKRWSYQPDMKLEDRYGKRMDAGNEVRSILKRNDALVLIAMAAIRKLRKDVNSNADRPIKRCAYIVRSLKTPEEVDSLRRVYGSNCIVIAAYASKRDREKMLADKISDSHFEPDGDRFTHAAKRLIVRDEKERGEDYGQNVRGTFWTADVFLNASHGSDALEKETRRFVDLLFGHPFSTPSRDECGLFQAQGAGLRSASAGRQVGAAIATPAGDIVAVGTNDVAKAFGGQYWPEDGVDHRDHKRVGDSNAAMTRNIIADLLVRLKRKGWFVDERAGLDAKKLLDCVEMDGLLKPFTSAIAEEEGLPSLAESARVKHVIEFIRAVHAEMAALMSAARRGIPVDGCTLYSTTFPCHECAKHIVAAGIRRVVFVEPYPKSRVADMYDDSIAIDDNGDKSRVTFQAFVGIAPRKYVELFTAPKRESNGEWVDFEKIKRDQDPRLGGSIQSYVEQEKEFVNLFDELLKKKHLGPYASEEVEPPLSKEN
jgi:cytidine deaminase